MSEKKTPSPSTKSRQKPVSLAKRSQLTFPVGRILSMLHKESISERVSPTAAIAFAAALDYLITEILNTTDDEMKKEEETKKIRYFKRVTNRNLNLVLRTDKDFLPLLTNTTFKKSGVIPKVFVSKKKKQVADNQ